MPEWLAATIIILWVILQHLGPALFILGMFALIAREIRQREKRAEARAERLARH